jgi:hypothetical protein
MALDREHASAQAPTGRDPTGAHTPATLVHGLHRLFAGQRIPTA